MLRLPTGGAPPASDGQAGGKAGRLVTIWLCTATSCAHSQPARKAASSNGPPPPPAFLHLLAHAGTSISAEEDDAHLSAGRVVLGTAGARHRRGLWAWSVVNYKFTCCGSRRELKLDLRQVSVPPRQTSNLRGPADICRTKHSLFSQCDALG